MMAPEHPQAARQLHPGNRWLLGVLAIGALMLSLCAGTCLFAQQDDKGQDRDEPPVRLKKRVKAATESAPEKKSTPDPKKHDPETKAEEAKDNALAEAAELEQKIKDVMNRLSRNLKTAEDRLDKKDPGEPTQQAQREIVKDLEELIELNKRQQQQQQQQSSSSSSSSSSQQEQQRRRQQRRQARLNRMRQNRSLAQRLEQTDPANDLRANNGRGGVSKEDMNRIADLYKDVWGHLPETLRQEMNQYSREQFMAKYNELLKQYYATIAEKGRRKGDSGN
jgi:hypothetical protein